MSNTRMELRRKRRDNLITAASILVIFGLLIALAFAFALALEKEEAPGEPCEEYQMYLANRDEEWFNTASEDYMEDPLESEHIEQAITEIPEKRYPMTDEEFYLVCGIVSAEAKGEPYEGMMAVAQTVLDNCERNNCRPDGVAWMYTTPDDTWSDEVWLAVTAVFFEGQSVFSEQVYWFYNPNYGYSEFHESQEFVAEIGNHRFFTEKEVK